ncbi:rCG52110 [Rattus norvegicus]|uniref:RCG52110 n=1 Tax=Rattus norvegicus TaxID=10116 RepID=A6K6G6_RAT|nr:rCG52110 [Rattus norvegicus]
MHHKTYTQLESGLPPLSRWKDSYEGHGTMRSHMASGEWRNSSCGLNLLRGRHAEDRGEQNYSLSPCSEQRRQSL